MNTWPTTPRRSRQGIALVITLIMLAITTITAVAFLAISRREKNSVTAAKEQTDARYFSDLAYNRARAEAAAVMLASGSKSKAATLIPTNYFQPAGFTTGARYPDPYNVSFERLSLESGREVIGNLLFNPRVPVFVSTNSARAAVPDNRFFLDLNRNGIFEPTYMERRRVPGTRITATNLVVGDPQWIGVLEHPDLPHSSSNRFIGRFSYIVVPSGRTLDINYSHNRAPQKPAGTDGYFRNQGLGSWEINLGAFFRELEPNLWNSYSFGTTPTAANTGLAFDDARRVLDYRGRPDDSLNSNLNLAGSFRYQPAVFLDANLDSPMVDATTLPRPDNENRDQAGWVGGDNRNQFDDIFELFKVDPAMTRRLYGNAVGVRTLQTTNYTFYRMLNQLSADSPDARYYEWVDSFGVAHRLPKLNLNWSHSVDIGASANVVQVEDRNRVTRPWDAKSWFMSAGDRLIKNEFTFRGYGFGMTNIPVRVDLLVTNPANPRQIVATNYIYDAQLHRLLQVAANIYQASTNRYASPGTNEPIPYVFQPWFYRDENPTTNGRLARRFNVFIGGFIQREALPPGGLTNFFLRTRWLDLEQPNDIEQLPTRRQVENLGLFDVNANGLVQDRLDLNRLPAASLKGIYGVPWVISAVQGLPAFNQAFFQQSLAVTRRIRMQKTGAITDTITVAPQNFRTNLQFQVQVTPHISLEAWNPHQNDIRRDLQVAYDLEQDFGIWNLAGANPVPGVANPVPVPFVSNRNNQFGTVSNFMRFRVQRVFPRETEWRGLPSGQAAYRGEDFDFPIRTYLFKPPGQSFPAGADAAGGTLRDLNEAFLPSVATNNLAYYPVSLPSASPHFGARMTNRVLYMVLDRQNRILDFVNLRTIQIQDDIFGDFVNKPEDTLVAESRSQSRYDFDHLWLTNRIGPNTPALGILNQIRASLSPNASEGVFRPAYGEGIQSSDPSDKDRSILRFAYFLFRDSRFLTNGVNIDVNAREINLIAATRRYIMTDRRAANDPMVHYTSEDLIPGAGWYVSNTPDDATLERSGDSGGFGQFPTTQYNFTRSETFRKTQKHPWARDMIVYSPWGTPRVLGNPSGEVDTRYDTTRKDPGILRADDWRFPGHAYPTLGWLGRVHRGTPWQTMFMKAGEVPPGLSREERAFEMSNRGRNELPPDDNWQTWAGNRNTHPHRDYAIFQLFTTAINQNAAQGLLSVNQEGQAAWSAVLSGVNTLGNNHIEPNTPEVLSIVNGINAARNRQETGTFESMGAVFSAPELTLTSSVRTNRLKFLSTADSRRVPPDSDAILERIPQQIASLIREDVPMYTIYAFGQSLKPAQGSLVTAPGKFYGLCTNYQITGEFSTKSVVRFRGAATNLTAVVENYKVIDPHEAQ